MVLEKIQWIKASKRFFKRFTSSLLCVFRKEEWSSGRFYRLKDVCWRDSTEMFVRYKELIRKPDSGIQEPKVLAPFYSKLQHMEDLFRVRLQF